MFTFRARKAGKPGEATTESSLALQARNVNHFKPLLAPRQTMV